MAKVDKKALFKAIEEADVEAVKNLLKNKATIEPSFLQPAYDRVSDLEQEYWDDKALYAGRKVEDSPQYEILELLKNAPLSTYKLKSKITQPISHKELTKNKALFNLVIDDKNEGLSRGGVEQMRAFFTNLPLKELMADGEFVASSYGYAAEYPTTAMIDLLLELGFDIKACDDNGENALFYLFCNKEPSVENIMYLAQKGLDLVHNIDGETPLHLKWHNSKLNIFKAAKKLGWDLDIPTIQGKWITPKKKGQSDEEYVKDKERYEERHCAGRTPLICAANDENHYKINLLIKFGVDVTLKDSLGKSALDYAEYGSKKTESFIKGGINKALAKLHEQTPIKGFDELSYKSIDASAKKFYKVKRSGDIKKLEKLFKDYDAKVVYTQIMPTGESIWDYCWNLRFIMQDNDLEFLKAFRKITNLSFGTNDNSNSVYKTILFHYVDLCRENVSLEILKYVLDSGEVDKACVNKYGESAFLFACREKNITPQILDLLCQIQIGDINDTIKEGNVYYDIGTNALMIYAWRYKAHFDYVFNIERKIKLSDYMKPNKQKKTDGEDGEIEEFDEILDLVRVLKKYGIKLNHKDSKGLDVLGCFSGFRDCEIAREIFKSVLEE